MFASARMKNSAFATSAELTRRNRFLLRRLRQIAGSVARREADCGRPLPGVTLVDASKWAIKRDIGRHTGYVTGVAFSPDGRFWRAPAKTARPGCGTWPTANSSANSTVARTRARRLPSLPTGNSSQPPPATKPGSRSRVRCESGVGDGKQLLSFAKHKQGGDRRRLLPDGKWLASTGFDHRVILYHFPTHTGSFSGRPHAANECRPVQPQRQSLGRARQAGGKRAITRSKSGSAIPARNWRPCRSTRPKLRQSAFRTTRRSWLRADMTSWSPSGTSRHFLPLPETKADEKRPGDKKHDKAKRDPGPIRVGMIGLDTSHCGAFAKVLNDPHAAPDVAGFKVVAASPRECRHQIEHRPHSRVHARISEDGDRDRGLDR